MFLAVAHSGSHPFPNPAAHPEWNSCDIVPSLHTNLTGRPGALRPPMQAWHRRMLIRRCPRGRLSRSQYPNISRNPTGCEIRPWRARDEPVLGRSPRSEVASWTLLPPPAALRRPRLGPVSPSFAIGSSGASRNKHSGGAEPPAKPTAGTIYYGLMFVTSNSPGLHYSTHLCLLAQCQRNIPQRRQLSSLAGIHHSMKEGRLGVDSDKEGASNAVR